MKEASRQTRLLTIVARCLVTAPYLLTFPVCRDLRGRVFNKLTQARLYFVQNVYFDKTLKITYHGMMGCLCSTLPCGCYMIAQILVTMFQSNAPYQQLAAHSKPLTNLFHFPEDMIVLSTQTTYRSFFLRFSLFFASSKL